MFLCCCCLVCELSPYRSWPSEARPLRDDHACSVVCPRLYCYTMSTVQYAKNHPTMNPVTTCASVC